MRAVVRMGDPGIDAGWVRRRSLGGTLALVWLVGTTIGVGAMAAGAVGPIGWIEGWQLRATGTASPVIAALPFMVLPFAPVLARLFATDVRRPLLLGVQQAFSPTSGPRFEPTSGMRARRIATMRAIATVVLVAGLLAMAAGIAWSWHASSAPVPPPVAVPYGDVIRGRAPAGPVLVTGAEQRSQGWLEAVRVRGSTVRSLWRVLLPPGDAGRVALVEKIAVGEDDAGRLRPYVRPTLSGRIAPLDDWTAARLREQGFALTDRPFVLERSMGDQGDAVDASSSGMLLAMFGSVAIFMGAITRWQAGRLAR